MDEKKLNGNTGMQDQGAVNDADLEEVSGGRGSWTPGATKKCPKCGKTYRATISVCPYCAASSRDKIMPYV